MFLTKKQIWLRRWHKLCNFLAMATSTLAVTSILMFLLASGIG